LKYWVIFRSSSLWHQAYCKPGFGHCFLITKDDFNWTLIDPGTDRLNVKILDCPASFDLPSGIILESEKEGQPIKVVEVDINEDRGYKLYFHSIFSLPFLNCVNMVKYVLGSPLKGLTPYKLWKGLFECERKSKYPYSITRIQTLN